MENCKKCDQPAKIRGYCKKHYSQANYSGEIQGKKILSRGMTIPEKLALRSAADPLSDCIVWFGAKNKKGYGQLGILGRNKMAHRLAYEHIYGPIPDGMLVCHRCDNPCCINPAHLFIGTNTDNMADMVAKGRQVALRGTDNKHAKLTEDIVRDIRSDQRKPRFIAADYGITPSHVWDIKQRVVWRHVD